jgi:Plasmid pRiA4b ORF-3-like protein
MRTEMETIVERLHHARSLPWLRVIDDADLDRSAEQAEMADVAVAPYRWLLKRVGSGVRLTQAGYMPPALVSEAMVALGWQDEWIGKHNREDQTLPILELRESAQRFGLLRKNRGQLLVTKAGRDLVADPIGLWWHLAQRLPDARSEPERHAGMLYLLTVAAGRALDDALLAEGMAILGWAERGTHQPLGPSSAFAAARDTWAMFRRLGLLGRRLRWDAPEPPPTPQARTLARAALLGRTGTTAMKAESRPARRIAEQVFQLIVTLRDIEPPIWRRLVVPASLTLRELHAVIQTAMGWKDYHLHMFDIDGVRYGDVEEIEGNPLGDEDSVTVGQAVAGVPEFSYEYDFGDSWTHDIRIEQIVASVGSGTPHLIGGARACPPEDCGGPSWYQELLKALADPGHEEHEHLLSWVGGCFDSEAFDLTATNANLELYDRHTRQRRVRNR